MSIVSFLYLIKFGFIIPLIYKKILIIYLKTMDTLSCCSQILSKYLYFAAFSAGLSLAGRLPPTKYYF